MKKKKNLSAYLRDFVMLIVLFAVVAVFAILGPVVADRMLVSVIQFVSTSSLDGQFRKDNKLQRTDSLQVVSYIISS